MISFLTYLLSIECSYGQFGFNCSERCFGHCINNESCHHVNGVCPRGCLDGFIGEDCNNCKKYSIILKLSLNDC